VNMPLMNGLEMLEKAREIHVFTAVVLSGYDEFHLAKQAMQLGVVDYLLKPVEHAQLFAALEQCKKRLPLMRQLRRAEAQAGEQLIPVEDLGEAVRRKAASPLVRMMIRYVEQRYAQKVGLMQLAQELGYSSGHLNKKFKQETGQSFTQFLNEYRIRCAVELMRQGETRINEIAGKVGFDEYKYFHVVFKKYAKYPPSAYLAHFSRQP
jgi:two-component system response regulator YesN